jgi:hypothetical protein
VPELKGDATARQGLFIGVHPWLNSSSRTCRSWRALRLTRIPGVPPVRIRVHLRSSVADFSGRWAVKQLKP